MGAPSPTKKNTGASSGGSSKAAKSGGSGLTFQAVVQDLEKTEQLVYGSAFVTLSPSSTPLPVMTPSLVDYVATNSSLAMDEVDTELLKLASTTDEMTIDKDQFVQIMQNSAVGEHPVLETFLSMGNGEVMEASECRTGMLVFFSDSLGPMVQGLSEDRWDTIFNEVLIDAGAEVNLEAWTNYCKRVARIIRMVHLAKPQ